MIFPVFPALWKRKGPLVMGLALLLIAAASLQFIRSEIVPFYPLYLDQNGYLSAAYAYADAAQREGFLSAVRGHLAHDSGRLGFLPSLNSNMSLAAAGIFQIVGEGRLAALGIHLLSFLFLLATVFFVFGRITRQAGYALLACAFLLFLKMPHVGAGGMEDFRMDFPAACWMGTSAALWVLFLHQPRTRYAWLATAAMGVLLFFRIIALVYLALPLGFLGLLLGYSFVTGKRRGLRRCLPPLLVFGAYAALLIGWDWSFLRSYYFDTQLGSDVAARGADKTWADPGRALLYYPLSLIENHFGWKPFYALLVAIFFTAGFRLCQKRPAGRKISLPIRWPAILFCLGAVIFPLIVLTANPHRTPQVAGVSAVPLALAGLLLFLAFSPRQNGRGLFGAGAALLFAGTAFWTAALFASAPFQKEARLDALALNPVFERMFRELTLDPGHPPNFAVYDFQEALIGYGVWFYGRERLGSDRKVSCIFPVQVQKIDADPLLAQLRQARLVILPRDPSILASRPYPISRSMLEHYPVVKADLLRHMALQSSFTYQGVLYDIFASK